MKKKFVILSLCLFALCFVELNAASDDGFDISRLQTYEKDCDNKAAKGCFYVGVAHFIGEGYSRDNAKAYEYLDKALKIEPQNTLFMSTIARMSYYNYKISNHVRDINESLELFLKACEYKDADSCNMLGSIYETGEEDVAANISKAGDYFKKSCDLKNQTGCGKLRTLKSK